MSKQIQEVISLLRKNEECIPPLVFEQLMCKLEKDAMKALKFMEMIEETEEYWVYHGLGEAEQYEWNNENNEWIHTEDEYVSGEGKEFLRIHYLKDGRTQWTYLNIDNKIHKDDGPAVTFYDEDRKVICEEWYINGKKTKEKHY
jgi:hypothetical protein